jgi:hypothetical protein
MLSVLFLWLVSLSLGRQSPHHKMEDRVENSLMGEIGRDIQMYQEENSENQETGNISDRFSHG